MGHACKNTNTHAHIPVNTHTHAHIYTCTLINRHTPMHVHTGVHACMHTHTGTHGDTHACTHIHVHTYTCAHLYMCTHIHPCTGTLVYMHARACTHTGMHGHAHTCAQRTPAKENVRSLSNECRCSLEREGSRALIASVGRAISGFGNGSQRTRQVACAWESSSDGDDFETAASEACRGVGDAGRWREGAGLKHEIRAAICPFLPVTEAARLPVCGLCPALHFPFTEILWGRCCGAPLPRGAGARPRRWG